jgi:O-antigen/teichoic acid export membrane protein
MIRHIAIYLVARGLAGAAGLIGIAAYTRLYSTEDFGRLTLVLTGTALISLVLTTGPRTAMLRQLSDHPDAARATTLWGLIIPPLLLCIIGIVVAGILLPAYRELTAAGCALLIVNTLHEFQLATAQGHLRPWHYAMLGGGRAALGTIFGVLLVLAGYGVPGAVWGVVAGGLVTLLANARSWFMGWGGLDLRLLRPLIWFALPMGGSAALNWLNVFSDRWLLAFFHDLEAAGLYAAAFDLPFQAVTLLFSVVILAGDPLVMNAYARGGAKEAAPHLRQVVNAMLALMLPALVGLILAGPLLVTILVGEAYRATALELLPWLSLSMFVGGLTLYPTFSFKLTDRTDTLLIVTAASAAANLALNLVLIPRYGPLGAALSSLGAYVLRLTLLFVMGNRLLSVPLPDWRIVLATLAATLAMSAWLWNFYAITAPLAVLYVIPGAVALYGVVLLWVLQLSGMRLSSLWLVE